MKNNQDGSALLWAIVLCFVLLIMVSGAMSVSYIYEKRSIEAHAQVQAYLSAKTIGDGLVKLLSSGSEEQQRKLIPEQVNQVITITDVTVPEQDVAIQTGSAVITKLSEQTISIKAESMQLEQKEEIIIIMKKQNEQWQVIQYDNQEPASE